MIYISNDCFNAYQYKLENKQYDFPLISGHFIPDDFIKIVKNIKTINFAKVKFYTRKKTIYCKIDNLVEWCFTHDTDFKKCKEAYFRRLSRWNNDRNNIIFVFNSFDRDYQQLSYNDILSIALLGIKLIIILDNSKHYKFPKIPGVTFIPSNHKSPEWYLYSHPYKYFYNNNDVNVIHMAGQCQQNYKKLTTRLLNCLDITGYNKEDFDILSCWTNDGKCILYNQLSKYGIPIINAVPKEDYAKQWYMPNKIRYIIDALENKCTNDIVMILDGYDVLFNSFTDIKKRFIKSGYKILYNGTKYNYPHADVGIIEDIDSDWRYFNAGCCIGYKDDLIWFYNEALKYIDIENPWNSEQYILRHVFEKCSDKVMFEYNPKIFITMGLTSVTQISEYGFKIESLGYEDNQKEIDT